MRQNKLPAALSTSLLALTLAASAGTLLHATDAHAQDEAAIMEARAKFQKALELEHAKNWGGALKLFREVATIKMTPQVRYHIATCEENLGQLVTALGGYELALAQAEGMHPDFIAEVQGSIDDLKARIPKLIIERAEGGEAAQIQLDGVQIGESSIGDEMPVDPGPHTVTGAAPGYEKFQQTISVAEGSVEVVSVTLEKSETPAAVGGGGGTSGPSPEEIAKKKKTYKTIGYIGLGVGGVGLIGGTVALVSALGKHGKLKDLCGDDLDCGNDDLTSDELSDARKFDRQSNSFEVAGWVGIGLGVAAAGTGVVFLMMGSGGDEAATTEEAGVTFRPYAPGADTGFSLVGRF